MLENEPQKKLTFFLLKYLPYILIVLTFTLIVFVFLTRGVTIARLFLLISGGFILILLLILWIKYQNIFSLENYSGGIERERYFLGILFSVIFTLSLLTVYFRENLYQRPTSYFILIFILTSLIIYEILTIKLSIINIVKVFIHIILLNLNISLSMIFLYPTIYGIDQWYHQIFTDYIIDFSHIPANYSQYSSFPNFHIINAVIQDLTTFDYKLSGIIFAIIIYDICLVMVIFLVGKNLFNERIGLIAALVCLINSKYLETLIQTMPFTFGFIFIVFILYLFICLPENRNIKINLLIILFYIATLLTHVLPAFFLLGLLFFTIIASHTYNYIYEQHQKPISIIMVCFLSILFISYYTSYSFSVIKYSMHQIDLNMLSTIPFYNYEHLTLSISNEIYSFFTINQYFYYIFSIIGILFILNYRCRDFRSNIFLLGIVIAFGIGFSGIITSMEFENYRWLYFASILNSIFFALSLFLLYKIIKENNYLKILLILLISFIFFNSLVSINPDNNIYSDPSNMIFAFEKAEIISFNTLYPKWDGIFAVDTVGRLPILFHREKNLEIDSSKFMPLEPEFSEMSFKTLPNRLVIIREKIRTKTPMVINKGIYKLNYDPISVIEKEHSIKIFNSGSIYTYSLT